MASFFILHSAFPGKLKFFRSFVYRVDKNRSARSLGNEGGGQHGPGGNLSCVRQTGAWPGWFGFTEAVHKAVELRG